MKDTIKNVIKILLITLLISIAGILLFPKENEVDAKITKSSGSKVMTTEPSGKAKYATGTHIEDQLPSDQVVDGHVFLSCQEFINNKRSHYTLFCCGHGVRLTSAAGNVDYSTGIPSGYVTVNGKQVKVIDGSGRKIALLYDDYFSSSTTVSRHNDDVTVNVKNSTDKDEDDAKKNSVNAAIKKAKDEGIFGSEPIQSITYGYYKIGSVEYATPAEAYILTEMYNNTVRNNYVQVAWWGVKTSSATSGGGSIGPDGKILDPNDPHDDNPYKPDEEQNRVGNTLLQEALDFETYILEVANSRGGHYTGKNMKSHYKRGTEMFDIDYTNSLSEIDTSNVDVLFDYKTNTYRIGPFSTRYIRAGTQRGSREAVDFAGISSATLKVKDENGVSKELELKHQFYEGTKGFRIVYDHKRDMHYYDVEDYSSYRKGTNFWYPYPYSGETFYIELDYKEDIASVEELKFDYHWTNGGGKYQDLTSGTVYIVEWEINAEWKETTEHKDGLHCHGSTDSEGHHTHNYVECHSSNHKYYKMDYWVWLKYKNHKSRETQPFENGLVGKLGFYEPDIGSEDSRVRGFDALSVSAGGWDLTTQISGYVWVEGIEYKKGQDITNFGNNKWNSGSKDKRKKNVEVRVHRVVYNKSGSTYTEVKREIAKGYKTKQVQSDGTVKLSNQYTWGTNRDTRLYTNDNGEYKIYLKIPSVENKASNQVVAYDVEFIYDGQTYEAVEYLASASGSTAKDKTKELQAVSENGKSSLKVDYSKYKDDSHVVESTSETATNTPVASGRKAIPLGRLNFDNNFYEIYGNDSSKFAEDKSSTGFASGKNKNTPINLKYKGKMYSEYAREVGEDSGGAGGENDRIVSLIQTEDSEYTKDEFQIASRTSTGNYILPYTDKIYIRHYTGATASDNLNKIAQLKENKGTFIDGAQSWYFPIYGYFNQVNLGLGERERVDISVAKDLYKAETIVNQQEITYRYSSLRDLENEDNGNYLHQLIEIQKTNQRYDFAMYSSDFYYRSDIYNHPNTDLSSILKQEKKDTELQMFATYKMILYNDSDTLDVTINNITDYFDANFTLVENDYYKTVIDSEGHKYQKLVAEQPYYRIYSLTQSTLDKSPYNYNSKEDLAVEGLVRSSSAPDRSVAKGKIPAGSWKVDSTTYGNNKYKKSTLDMFKYREKSNNIVDSSNSFVLAPGERIELFVTYEIDNAGYNIARGETFGQAKTNNARTEKLLGGKNNVIEVGEYSSFYTKTSINKHKTVAYKEHQVAGRIDQDSAPNNINLSKTKKDEKGCETLDKKWFDDDIESAPVFRIYLRESPDDNRQITGIVWEDKDASDVEGNSATGDGIYNSGEKGIPGVTVSLVEKIRAPSPGGGDTVEYEFVWPDEITGVMDGYEPVTKTASDGTYTFKNFTPGIYQVRFEYGNSDATLKYNGQDYENTAYQTHEVNASSYDDEEIKNCDTENKAGQPTLNNEWHDLGDNETAKKLEADRVSDARDYEPQRLRVIAYSRTISNSIGEVFKANDLANSGAGGTLSPAYKKELIAGTAMIANTAKLNFEVEKSSEIDYSDYNITGSTTEKGPKYTNGIAAKLIKNADDSDVQQEPHEYLAKNIDFGLEERAKSSIQLDKYLKKIQLIKNIGKETILQISIDDDERIIRNAEGTLNDGKVLSLLQSDGVQGYKYITMDSSYFQDLTVKLTYRIDVINEGEVDFTSQILGETYTADEINEMASALEGNYTDNITPIITGESIYYGDFAGHYYYTNEVDPDNDTIVRTTVNQLVDYIDSNMSVADESTNNSEDLSWKVDNNYAGYQGGLLTTLDGLISEASYKSSDGKLYLADDLGNIFITETKDNLALSLSENIHKENRTTIGYERDSRNNRRKMTTAGYTFATTNVTRGNAYGYVNSSEKDNNFNRKLTKELTPISYTSGEENGEKGEVTLVTSTTIATPEDANDMNYNNLAEVLVYSNTVGRRTFMQNINDTEEHKTIGKDHIGPTTPGNALEIAKDEGMWEAGHSSNLHTRSSFAEIDADATEYVTFTEPTGLKYADLIRTYYLQIILAAMIVLAIGILLITVKVVKQKRR